MISAGKELVASSLSGRIVSAVHVSNCTCVVSMRYLLEYGQFESIEFATNFCGVFEKGPVDGENPSRYL